MCCSDARDRGRALVPCMRRVTYCRAVRTSACTPYQLVASLFATLWPLLAGTVTERASVATVSVVGCTHVHIRCRYNTTITTTTATHFSHPSLSRKCWAVRSDRPLCEARQLHARTLFYIWLNRESHSVTTSRKIPHTTKDAMISKLGGGLNCVLLCYRGVFPSVSIISNYQP